MWSTIWINSNVCRRYEYYCGDDIEQLKADMLQDLAIIQEWLQENQLDLNLDKTKAVVMPNTNNLRLGLIYR